MPHDIIMPALGMAQETGKIISWLKQPGDAVTAGDVIMEVETDKSVMEVEAQASGFLTRVTAKAGDDVPVPFSPALEDLTVPTPSAVAERARKLLRRELFDAA